MMTSWTIQMTGEASPALADELQRSLMGELGGEAVGDVELLRTDEVIALINLIFAGISSAAALTSSAHVVWQWWQDRKPSDIQIVIERSDGSRVELAGDVTREQIEAVLAEAPSTETA